MNNASIFPIEPFPGQLDLEDEMRRARLPKPPRPKPGNRPQLPRIPRPKVIANYRAWPDNTYPTTPPIEPSFPEPLQAQGSEHVRWVQDCLNHLLSTRLPVDGVMTPATRSTLRRFQRQQGLRPTGILGPDSMATLQEACSAAPISAADREEEFEGGGFFEDSNLFRIEAPSLRRPVISLTNRIIDLTAMADRSHRRGVRDPQRIRAVVLQQMACCFTSQDSLRPYLGVGAHFSILADGRILQLHPVSAILGTADGLNSRSVAVAFAGNFPDTRGQWWRGERFGMDLLTEDQIRAGRYLMRHLARTLGLKFVLAHRQSNAAQVNDPGPDIWYHVGQWAIQRIGLSDGGPGFKVGSGRPIPEVWKGWGHQDTSHEINELKDLDSGKIKRLMFREAIEAAKLTVKVEIDKKTKKEVRPGIYTIYKKTKINPFYVGQAIDLPTRLLQHLRCLTLMGISSSNYQVKFEPTPIKDLNKREQMYIAHWKRKTHGGSLNNVKTKELDIDQLLPQPYALALNNPTRSGIIY